MYEPKYDIKRGADTYRFIYHSRLRSWILKGIIKRDEALVWRSGLSGWRKPEDLEELKPYFQKQDEESRKRERVETSSYLFSRKVIKDILVIDDEQDLCWLLSNILEGEGYHVSTANTINDGMTCLKEAPDLLFLDLKLPDGDGMDMLPRIRDIAPETFVVIISAYGSEEKKGTAEDAGVCRFLDKPFTGEQILEIIEQLSPPLPSQINKQNDTHIQIRNRWKPDQYINISSGSIQCTTIESGWHSAQWAIERIQGTAYIQIRNRWKPDQYINISSGSIQCTTIESGWHSAQWAIERIQGTAYIQIRNRWKPDQYINISSGSIQCTTIESGWHSAQWCFE